MKPSEKQNSVDLYFMEARAKLIDIAAFMDRVERDGLTEDFRYQAFKEAMEALDSDDRAENVLEPCVTHINDQHSIFDRHVDLSGVDLLLGCRRQDWTALDPKVEHGRQ